ncbi:unnamed protein product [Calypogeia fissa]
MAASAAGMAATKKLLTPGAFSLVRQCRGIRMPVGHPLYSSSSTSSSSAAPASSVSTVASTSPASEPSDPPPKHGYNPPDRKNPDAVTLQEQWRYATRMYSKWYASAWGTAIMAGLSFYALGWFIKGENPLRFGTSAKKEEQTQKAE